MSATGLGGQAGWPSSIMCPREATLIGNLANSAVRSILSVKSGWLMGWGGEGYRAWNSLYYDKSPVGQRKFSSVRFVFPVEGGSCGPQPFVNSFPRSLAWE